MGPNGTAGPTGPQGFNGSRGLPGPRGTPGAMDPRGYNASQGLAGPLGPPGKSAAWNVSFCQYRNKEVAQTAGSSASAKVILREDEHPVGARHFLITFVHSSNQGGKWWSIY